MKKWISLVLCVCIIFSITTVSFAKSESNDSFEYEERLRILTEIGVLEDSFVQNYDRSTIHTRGDLA